MMAHINSNYIHLRKNKPMVWRFKPRFLHSFPSFGWVENLLTSFFKARPKAKIKTHLSRRSAEVPARLCKTGRAIPEIMKPFTTPFLAHSQDWQLWKCTFPRGESQETCKWPDDSFKRIFLWRSLEQAATSIVADLVKVVVIGLANNI